MLTLARSVAGALLMCGLSCVALGAQTPGREATTQQAFTEVVDATGESYVRARSELLSQEGVEEFLEKVSNDDARPDDVRWLAEILLTRKRKSQEFDELVEDFAQKAMATYPFVRITLKASFGPARLPEQGIPTIEELKSRHGSEASITRQYLKSKQLVTSPLWGAVTGEVVLKGWTRSPDLPPGTQFGYLGPDNKPLKAVAPLPPPGATLYAAHWVYLQSAVCVLGHLREQRARLPLEKMLRDSTQHESVRVRAAVSLYRLGDRRSIEVLRVVARDRDDVENVRGVVQSLLANLPFSRALPPHLNKD